MGLPQKLISGHSVDEARDVGDKLSDVSRNRRFEAESDTDTLTVERRRSSSLATVGREHHHQGGFPDVTDPDRIASSEQRRVCNITNSFGY
jgi:hypothetical protein